MSQNDSGPWRIAHADQANRTPPKRRKLALGTIMILNAVSALLLWLTGSLFLRMGHALLRGA